MSIDYRIGDSREVTAGIPDGSVDLIASSPPFLALRSYLPSDHVSKGDEIGSEANPAAFIDTLLGLTAEWGRVLAPHGSLAIELGDTYSGSGGAGGDYGPAGLRDGQQVFDGSQNRSRRQAQWGTDTGPPRRTTRPRNDGGQYGCWPTGGEKYNTDDRPIKGNVGWPVAKSLALIPQLYAVALAYGINPLTGAESPAGRWRVRNVIVWHRPNPAVGALGDKVRPSTSYIVVATRSAKRWFDLTAVRGEPSANTHARLARGVDVAPRNGKSADRDGNYDTMRELATTAGAPPLDTWFDEYDATHDTWTLTTQPSKLAHYAMWPAKLAERLILSMCPQWVCSMCGEPRNGPQSIERRHLNGGSAGFPVRADMLIETLGWTDCGHDTYRPGVTLDPFAGTGTTLAVAELHGRDSIGIDLDPRNRDLLEPRMAECKRALFGTPAPMPGQGDLFAEVPA